MVNPSAWRACRETQSFRVSRLQGALIGRLLMLKNFTRWNREILEDIIIIFSSVWLSYSWRLAGTNLLRSFIPMIWITCFSALLIKFIVFYLVGIYRIYWKYIGRREIAKLLGASLAGSIMLGTSMKIISDAFNLLYPRSIIGLDFFISTSLLFIYRSVLFSGRSEYK